MGVILYYEKLSFEKAGCHSDSFCVGMLSVQHETLLSKF